MITKQDEFHKIWFSGNTDSAYQNLCAHSVLFNITTGATSHQLQFQRPLQDFICMIVNFRQKDKNFDADTNNTGIRSILMKVT